MEVTSEPIQQLIWTGQPELAQFLVHIPPTHAGSGVDGIDLNGRAPMDSAIYRVRVTVLSPEQVPVEDAKVWSSFGGELKRVAGGWQVDIPNASKPQNGNLTFFASREMAFLTGKADLVLSFSTGQKMSPNCGLDG